MRSRFETSVVSFLLLTTFVAACAHRNVHFVGAAAESENALPTWSKEVHGDDAYYRLFSEFALESGHGREGAFPQSLIARGDCKKVGGWLSNDDVAASLTVKANGGPFIDAHMPSFIFNGTDSQCELTSTRTYLTPWTRLEPGERLVVDTKREKTAKVTADVDRLAKDVGLLSGAIGVAAGQPQIAVAGAATAKYLTEHKDAIQESLKEVKGASLAVSEEQPVFSHGGTSLEASILPIHFDEVIESFLSSDGQVARVGTVRIRAEFTRSMFVGQFDDSDQRFAKLGTLPLAAILERQLPDGLPSLGSRLIDHPGDSSLTRANAQAISGFDTLQKFCQTLAGATRAFGFNSLDRAAIIHGFINETFVGREHWAFATEQAAAATTVGRLEQIRDSGVSDQLWSGCLDPAVRDAITRMGLVFPLHAQWTKLIEHVKRQQADAADVLFQEYKERLESRIIGPLKQGSVPSIASFLRKDGDETVVITNESTLHALRGLPANQPKIVGREAAAKLLADLRITNAGCIVRASLLGGDTRANALVLLFASTKDGSTAAMEVMFEASDSPANARIGAIKFLETSSVVGVVEKEFNAASKCKQPGAVLALAKSYCGVPCSGVAAVSQEGAQAALLVGVKSLGP